MRFTFLLRRRLPRTALALALLALSLPCAEAAQGLYHVLEKGETLYSVARSYGLKPETIARANSIDDPAKLRAGTKLLIPGVNASASADAQAAIPTASSAAEKHKVVKGDTLFSIARSYGVGLSELRAVNKLNASSVIKPGDTLMIPAGSSVSGGEGGTAPAMPDPVKTSPKVVSKGLSWPCPGEILYLDGKAYGVIIKTKQGESQRAVIAGTVSSAGPYRGYGNVVFVLSRTGHIYVYGGNDRISVRAGDRITAGQELGKVGMDLKQGGPTAYFLVFKNGEAVDPAAAPRD